MAYLSKKKNRIYALAIFLLFNSLLFSQSRRSADKFTFNNKTQIFTYTGNAKLEDKDALITSYVMKFYKADEVATFNGNVRILSKTNGSTINSGFASYNGKTRFSYAKIKPVLRSSTNNMIIRSEYMERDFNTPYARALTNVRLNHVDPESKRITDGYSDELLYDMDSQISTMIGNPILIQGEDKLEGEILEYNSRDSTANVMGGGKVYLLQTNSYSKEGEIDTNSKVSNYNIITADRIFMEDRGGVSNTTRMLYAYGNVTAFFYEENMILKGDYIVYNIDEDHMFVYDDPSVRIPNRGIIGFGKWIEYKKDGVFKDVIFHEDVVMIDYDESISLEGSLLHLDPDTKIATVSGSPYAYLEDRKVRIKSITMQRFNTEEKLRANGDVKVESRDMNSESAWATYYDKQKYLRLWGENPALNQGGSIVRAREIIYYIDTAKIEASSVSGEMPE